MHFRNGDRGRRRLRRGPRPSPPPSKPGRIPRISRLMALAIHFEELIHRGVVKDHADLARLGGVSRARISQVMDLLNLVPSIQESLLFLKRSPEDNDPVTERALRRILVAPHWTKQIELWTSAIKSAKQ
ncbi:MAG: hypothetical protein GF355_02250 [Candidatus Eisenbacteria bacterium]|nr:hypothetical protein [Candidatus Eisenbacteria bacterium]